MKDHSLKYTLDENHNVIATKDLFQWADWFETADRRVKETTVGEFWVSTVFLGLDYAFCTDGPPRVFETMIRHKEEWMDYQPRYSTWDEAIEGHDHAVKLVERLSKWKRKNEDA